MKSGYWNYEEMAGNVHRVLLAVLPVDTVYRLCFLKSVSLSREQGRTEIYTRASGFTLHVLIVLLAKEPFLYARHS